MNLTPAQQTTFAAAINANTNTISALPGVTAAFVGVQVKNVTHGNNQDGVAAVAAFYNQLAAGPFLIFNSAVLNADIFNQVLFANYTPVDAISSGNAQQWAAASLACQGKQFNLQIMIQPGGTFDATRVNLRKGLKDAMTVLPSAAGFAVQDGGWNTSLNTCPNVLTRSATIFESLFAIATTGPLAAGSGSLGAGGIQGTANVSVPATDSQGGYLQGSLAGQDILNIWSP
jgi:hypothetical protein